jgi:TRAP-type uncharacterized transport system substrate-binding protein
LIVSSETTTSSFSVNSSGTSTTSYVAGGRLAQRLSNDANGLAFSRVQPGRSSAASTQSAKMRHAMMVVSISISGAGS